MSVVLWDGTVSSSRLPASEAEKRKRLFASAKTDNWAEVFSILKASPDLINAVEPDDLAFNTLLHIATKYEEKADIIQELVNCGALRSIQNAFEQTPLDFANDNGLTHLYPLLQIPNQLGIDKSFLAQVNNEFLNLFYEQLRIRTEFIFRPPQLEPILEANNSIRFVMWRFLGEAKYWIAKDEVEKPKLYLFTGSRFVQGSEQTHEISPEGSKRIR